MDIFTALENRRSCREFSPDAVDPATVPGSLPRLGPLAKQKMPSP